VAVVFFFFSFSWIACTSMVLMMVFHRALDQTQESIFLTEEEGVWMGVVGRFVSGVRNGWIWHRLDQD
jgi:hypothetical protein